MEKILRKLETERQEEGGGPALSVDLVYVDDTASTIVANTGDELKVGAHQTLTWIRSILKSMSLELNEKKTVNLILKPYYLLNGIYRRMPIEKCCQPKKLRDRSAS